MLLWCELWSDLKFYFFKEGSEKVEVSKKNRKTEKTGKKIIEKTEPKKKTELTY
jgi:hypothetical protein